MVAGDGAPGCLRVGVGLATSALLAPLVAVVRRWRSVRRGRQVLLTRGEERFPSASDAAWVRLDLVIDAPVDRERALRLALTELVVRAAEALRVVDDVYHQVFRRVGEAETDLEPVGPQVQALGERFSLTLAQRDLAFRTLLWLTLPSARRLAEVVDPLRDDPEAPGQPEEMLARPGLRWAAASSFGVSGPSAIGRVILVVPQAGREAVAALLERFAASATGTVAAVRKLC